MLTDNAVNLVVPEIYLAKAQISLKTNPIEDSAFLQG